MFDNEIYPLLLNVQVCKSSGIELQTLVMWNLLDGRSVLYLKFVPAYCWLYDGKMLFYYVCYFRRVLGRVFTVAWDAEGNNFM